MASKVVIVIPARFGSSRFPGKPLADLIGKPVVQHGYEKALTVKKAYKVVVATDDQRIADCVLGFGGEVVMTSDQHPSGTDRLVEIMEGLESDIYINLQGDEPLIRPTDVDRLVGGMLEDEAVDVGTLYHEIEPTGPGVDTPEGLEEVRRILKGVHVPVAARPLQSKFADVNELADRILVKKSRLKGALTGTSKSDNLLSLQQ